MRQLEAVLRLDVEDKQQPVLYTQPANLEIEVFRRQAEPAPAMRSALAYLCRPALRALGSDKGIGIRG
jgi:hypothetical protein